MSSCMYDLYQLSERPIPTSSVLVIIICTLGLIGNLVAIFVILVLKEQKKSVTHWYILQLAVADTIFLSSLPFKVTETLCFGWIFPEWMCKASEAVLFLNFYSSTIFLMIMSIDRYIAVCHPFSSRLQSFRKHSSALLITCFTWIISILLCIPVILSTFIKGDLERVPSCTCQYDFSVLSPEYTCEGKHCSIPKCFNRTDFYDLSGFASAYGTGPDFVDLDEDYNYTQRDLDAYNSKVFEGLFSNNSNTLNYLPVDNSYDVPPHLIHAECGVIEIDRHSARITFVAFNFSVMFLLPLLVMVFCYGLITLLLSSTQIKPSRLSSTSSESSLKRRKSSSSSSHSDNSRRRVTVMCATLVSTFALCWLPFHSMQLGEWIGIKGTIGETCNNLRIVGTLLAYLNSALNPYLYTFLGTNFSRRLITAGITIRNSLRRRTSSTGAFVASRPNRKAKERNHSASTNTKVTKFLKASSVKHSHDTSSLHENKRSGGRSPVMGDDGKLSKM